MSPDDELPPNDSNDAAPVPRDLRMELVRLQARVDQLAAAARDRIEETSRLHSRVVELDHYVDRMKQRYRRALHLWGWVGLIYGIVIGVVLSCMWRI